jgi:hypothetical protein
MRRRAVGNAAELRGSRTYTEWTGRLMRAAFEITRFGLFEEIGESRGAFPEGQNEKIRRRNGAPQAGCKT